MRLRPAPELAEGVRERPAKNVVSLSLTSLYSAKSLDIFIIIFEAIVDPRQDECLSMMLPN